MMATLGAAYTAGDLDRGSPDAQLFPDWGHSAVRFRVSVILITSSAA